MPKIEKDPKMFTGPKKKDQRRKKSQIKEELKAEFGGKMERTLNILNGIRKRSMTQESKTWDENYQKFDNLESLLHRKEIHIQSLGNLSANEGSTTKGSDNETIDGISLKKIDKITVDIKEGTFKFKPFRMIMIPKPRKTKKRPLGIPCFTDRIVQGSILLILESIYEPVFEKLEVNFGFRKRRSAHQALLRIKEKGAANFLAIEGDIKSAYPTVSHKILMRILEKRISDHKFLKIIYQGLKCGLLYFGKREDTLIGTPQGGIASPILFNIYMHEFDEYITTNLQNFINEYNTKNERINTPKNIEWLKYQNKLENTRAYYKKVKGIRKYIDHPPEVRKKLSIKLKEIKFWNLKRLRTPYIDMRRKEIRIMYTRYADDWIMLTNCKKSLALILKQKITSWLKENLEFELDPIKTKITRLHSEQATFLGFTIYNYRKRRISKSKKTGNLIKDAGWAVRIGMDKKRVLDRQHDNGFCDENKKHYPIAKSPYIHLRPEEIIKRFNALRRGLANYYLPVIDTKSSFSQICYILKYSCLKTLAAKYKTKISKIVKRFGYSPITVKVDEEMNRKGLKGEVIQTIKASKEFKHLEYLDLLEITKEKRNEFKNGNASNNVDTDVFFTLKTINWRTYRNLTSICIICGISENGEMHHVKAIRKEKVKGFTQVMKQLNRRQVPLCRTHHIQVERGYYDGVKLTDLFDIDRFTA
jgi:nicotine oxidoreductase